MQRLMSSGTSLMGSVAAPRLKKKVLNSWAAVQDTFFSTKDTFERHKVVFTVGTSLASVATAWIGYSLRHYHDSQVERRLQSIEKAMNEKHNLERSEISKLVNSGGFSAPTCIATAGTTLILGYGFGWKGGKWYANRQFKREQMKLMGQMAPRKWQFLGRIKPKGWQLQFFRQPLIKARIPSSAGRKCEKTSKKSPSPNRSSDIIGSNL